MSETIFITSFLTKSTSCNFRLHIVSDESNYHLQLKMKQIISLPTFPNEMKARLALSLSNLEKFHSPKDQMNAANILLIKLLRAVC